MPKGQRNIRPRGGESGLLSLMLTAPSTSLCAASPETASPEAELMIRSHALTKCASRGSTP
jgi:hypothetical protein